MASSKKTHLLVILDGWGERPACADNAITSAKTPCWQHLWQTYPHRLLDASGEAVGLPAGQIGNSEVGHLHLGAGRLVRQDLSRINHDIATGQFFENATLRQAMLATQQRGGRVHLLGLLSPGGVHSHEQHCHALLTLAKQLDCQAVSVHAFLDGRDCPPQSAAASIERLQAHCQYLGVGELASICGRYYAMDRDNRWQRVEQAYRMLTKQGEGIQAASALEALQASYQRDELDEFVKPTQIQGCFQPIADGDLVCFFNFRSDRARQLSHAFLDEQFQSFPRQQRLQLSGFVSMTEYASDLPTQIAYPKTKLSNVLGQVVADQGLRQLRLAETEKYAHVTFFLNGGEEAACEHEERLLVPSPKVATYDLQPEMSAAALTDALCQAILSDEYDLIVCNYANADMVGHTGDFAAACLAIEAVDNSLQRVMEALAAVEGRALITADHGNAECMLDPHTQQPHTAHTNLQVPLIYVSYPQQASEFIAGAGALSDVAPTLLSLLELPLPAEMTGKNLLAS